MCHPHTPHCNRPTLPIDLHSQLLVVVVAAAAEEEVELVVATVVLMVPKHLLVALAALHGRDFATHPPRSCTAASKQHTSDGDQYPHDKP